MASLVSKEQWYSYIKQREEEAKQYIDAWMNEQIEKEKQKSEIEQIARETARNAAKEYIASERRNIEIEVDKRSIQKVWEELLKGF